MSTYTTNKEKEHTKHKMFSMQQQTNERIRETINITIIISIIIGIIILITI